MTQTPTPIDYSDLPVGRLGPRASGCTASLVVTPAAENGGERPCLPDEQGAGQQRRGDGQPEPGTAVTAEAGQGPGVLAVFVWGGAGGH